MAEKQQGGQGGQGVRSRVNKGNSRRGDWRSERVEKVIKDLKGYHKVPEFNGNTLEGTGQKSNMIGL